MRSSTRAALRRALTTTVALAAILAPGSAPAAATPCSGAAVCPYDATAQIGLLGDGVLRTPSGMALAPGGDLYVADEWTDRVERFAPDHSSVAQLTGRTSGAGAFRHPRGVAVDPAGDVYVGDGSGGRVLEFDDSGAFVKVFSTAAVSPQGGMAFGPSGHLFVAEQDQIAELDATGAVVRRFGTTGTGAGEFQGVGGLAGDTAHLFAVDTRNDRVQVFTVDGTGAHHVTDIGPDDAAHGGSSALSGPEQVALDGAGHIYVAASYELREYTLSGTVATVVATGSLPPQTKALAVSSDGATVHAADVAVHDLTKAGATWSEQSHFGFPAGGRLFYPHGTAFSTDGAQLYVADSSANRIQVFTYEGGTLDGLLPAGDDEGVPGSLPGAFNDPRDIAVLPDGRLLVADYGNRRVQVLESDGTPVAQITDRPDGDPAQPFPVHVAAGANGRFAWSDGFGAVFEEQLTGSTVSYVRTVGTLGGSADGQFGFSGPGSLAYGPDGSLLAADPSNDRVMQFAADGTFVRSIGGPGFGEGSMQQPQGVTYDPSVGIVVADVTQRVQIFDETGAFVAGWGGQGIGTGQFQFVQDVAVSAAGDVVVVDSFDQVVKRFDLTLARGDAGVTLSDAPDPGVTGSAVTYTAHVTNHGPHDLTGVTVRLAAPAGWVAGALPGGCSASDGGRTVDCAIGALAAGASADRAVPFTAGAPGAASVTATVAFAGTDTASSDDEATETTTVNPAGGGGGGGDGGGSPPAPAPAPAPAASPEPAVPAAPGAFGVPADRLAALGLAPASARTSPDTPQPLLLDYLPFKGAKRPASGVVAPGAAPRTSGTTTGRIGFWTAKDVLADVTALNRRGVPVALSLVGRPTSRYAGQNLIPGEVFAQELLPAQMAGATTSVAHPLALTVKYYEPATPTTAAAKKEIARQDLAPCEELKQRLGAGVRAYDADAAAKLKGAAAYGCLATVTRYVPTRSIDRRLLSEGKLVDGGRGLQFVVFEPDEPDLALTPTWTTTVRLPSWDTGWQLPVVDRTVYVGLTVSSAGLSNGQVGPILSHVQVSAWWDPSATTKRLTGSESMPLGSATADRHGNVWLSLAIPDDGTVRFQATATPAAGPELEGWTSAPARTEPSCFLSQNGLASSAAGKTLSACGAAKARSAALDWPTLACGVLCFFFPQIKDTIFGDPHARATLDTVAVEGTKCAMHSTQTALGAKLQGTPSPGQVATGPVSIAGGGEKGTIDGTVVTLPGGAGATGLVQCPDAPDALDVTRASAVQVGATALISRDGSGLISQDGSGLISQDGAGLIGQAGGNLIGQAGGNLIGHAGGNWISTNGGNLIGQAGGN
jgi:uncharacterized repeat protein (TIGR01451 family)